MTTDPKTDFWRVLYETPLLVWAALIAGVLYVLGRDKDAPFLARVQVAGVSGFGAFATHRALSDWTGWPPELVMLGLTAVGYAVLDVIWVALTSPDFRAELRQAVLHRIRGGRTDDR